ncbi:MAG: hypothetical protein PHE49_09555 [bacterium]|nr:hypothetical protein [bacterium]
MKFEDLKKKGWYRAIQVLWGLGGIIVVIFTVSLTWDSTQTSCDYINHELICTDNPLEERIFWVMVGGAIALLAGEVIRRIFYYIATGKVLPETSETPETKENIIKETAQINEQSQQPKKKFKILKIVVFVIGAIMFLGSLGNLTHLGNWSSAELVGWNVGALISFFGGIGLCYWGVKQ